MGLLSSLLYEPWTFSSNLGNSICAVRAMEVAKNCDPLPRNFTSTFSSGLGTNRMLTRTTQPTGNTFNLMDRFGLRVAEAPGNYPALTILTVNQKWHPSWKRERSRRTIGKSKPKVRKLNINSDGYF